MSSPLAAPVTGQARLSRMFSATPQEAVEVEPDWPFDVDAGPLFCEKENRCFLVDGKRCSQFQQRSRTKGLLQDIRDSSGSWGFLLVRNIVFEPNEFTSLHRRAEAIAEMPQEAKQLLHIEKNPLRRGWAPVGHAAWQQGGAPSQYESFEVARGEGGDALGPWPSAELKDAEGFKEEVGAAFERLERAALQLSTAIASALGVSPEAFNSQISNASPSSLRFLSFPTGPPSPPSEAATSPALFTLLTQSRPTIQILDEEGQWNVPLCGPDRTVLLFGEALAELSKNHIPASKYRFATDGAEPTHIVEFSVHLNPDVKMEPLAEFKEEGHAAAGPPKTQLELLQQRIQAAC